MATLTRGRRPRSLVVVGAIAIASLAMALGGALHPDGSSEPELSAPARPLAPSCVVSASSRLHLEIAQAANATTIAAVGKRLGMADRAVAVALVASLQESKLRNLPNGDLDSVGLFQQRPSQGWGEPTQLIDPAYAASAFYHALMRVPAWESLPVGDAAQAVQRSARPDAYADWERQGRTLADALTGASGAALTCRFEPPGPQTVTTTPSLEDAVAAELGPSALGATVSEPRGWTVAGWLVGHAYGYRISSVTFLGQEWTPSSGKWQPQGVATAEVGVTRS